MCGTVKVESDWLEGTNFIINFKTICFKDSVRLPVV